MSRTFTAAVHREDDWYVTQCLDVDVCSQGASIDEAVRNLAEAVQLYLDEVDEPQQHVTATPLVTSFQIREPRERHSGRAQMRQKSRPGPNGGIAPR